MTALSGIHYLEIAVSDLAVTERFSVAAFGARRLPEADHVDAGGLRLRLHTLETHGPELPADVGNPWLAS